MTPYTLEVFMIFYIVLKRFANMYKADWMVTLIMYTFLEMLIIYIAQWDAY